ncbi:hypothetical protein AGMMS49532_01020 [Endomicrobiia bacterium]|nr:hypothetical protein AGMMS49532_01020 [Endomicrobiia bacterium]GHT23378.1 hypothetical protein AGMMS49953_03840 [Endomicrobiia bacterium]GMO51446.1 MAG: hypothetical protein Ta2C_01070 [Candidatus Endomicrobium trichonymphae]
MDDVLLFVCPKTTTMLSVWNDHLKDWEYLDWCKMWILELARVTKSTGSIFLHPYGPLVSDV